MQRPFQNLSPEDRRVYRNVVGGLFALYAMALVVVACMIVDNQITQAAARDDAASVTAKSTEPVDVRPFRQAVMYD